MPKPLSALINTPTRSVLGTSIWFFATLMNATTLLVRGSANTLILLIVILSAFSLRNKPWRQMIVMLWPLMLTMLSLEVTTLLSILTSKAQSLRELDTPLRFALFPIVLWGTLQTPSKYLKHLEWGFIIATIGASLLLYLTQQTTGLDRPIQVGFTNLLAFSNITLLMGILSGLSLLWSAYATQAQKLLFIIKTLSCFLGLYTSYASGSRGGWLALPFFAVIGIWHYPRPWSYKLILLAMFITSLLILYNFSPQIHNRIHEAQTEYRAFQSGQNLDSSIGSRLQLWQAAWSSFKSSPILGIGKQNYMSTMHTLSQAGIITPYVAAYRHSHNELLFNLATLGIIGFISVLALYCVPSYWFYHYAKHGNQTQKTAGLMGLFVCVGFFAFGLTEVMFTVSMIASFYTVLLACLFTICIRSETKPDQQRSNID